MITKNQERKMILVVKKKLLHREEASGGMGYRFFHSMRVYTITKKFLKFKEIKNRKIDTDALLVAALFHDIGRSRSRKKVLDAVMPGHDKGVIKILKSFLKGIIDINTIERAAKLIEPNNDKTHWSLEKELLTYADDLDSIGALNIWRMFTYSAYKKEKIDDKLECWDRVASERYNKVGWMLLK